MLLETARRYNHETECITFLKDFTYSKDDFHRAGLWRTLAQDCVYQGQVHGEGFALTWYSGRN